VELFEEIRREYEFGAGTIKGVARKLRVHRRLVREALANSTPQPNKRPVRSRPALAPAVEFIDGILREDERTPRKQRHTAHRIYTRIQSELPGCSASEASVRRYVRQRKQELGLAKRETYVPQSYEWGVEAQVDFHEPQRRCQRVHRFSPAAAAAAAVVLFRIRLPFAFFDGRSPDAYWDPKSGRCCQLVHGLEDPINLRSHRIKRSSTADIVSVSAHLFPINIRYRRAIPEERAERSRVLSRAGEAARQAFG
jgi:hypothetical protein